MEQTNTTSATIEWKPFKRVRQYEYALEKIREMIAAGSLKPGDRLPSERELSSKLGVGRASVKEALRILEILGLIEVRLGDGSFIKQDSFHFFESIANTVRLFSELTAETMANFLDFRSFWEIKCAALAAKNSTEEDIRMMENEIQRMENGQQNDTEFKAADINFHNLMCIASRDKAIMLVVQGLRNILISFFDNVYPLICSDTERGAQSFISHKNLMQAIKDHDEIAVVRAMEEHLKEARKNLLDSYHYKNGVEQRVRSR
jgi:GntR family transcriptional repressor for pyruvate dehydrogenase complex